MRTPLLDADALRALHAAAVSARLDGSRQVLLAGIDGGFVAGLSIAASPADQVLLDLDALAKTGALADGSIPLRTWLANAAQLAGLQVEAAVFTKALAALGAPAAASAPAAAEAMRPAELVDALGRMLPAQFERLLLWVGVPAGDIHASTAPQAVRAADVIRWAADVGAVPEVARAYAEITARRRR